MKCKICDQLSELKFNATILGKHDVGFYVCTQCGFGQTDEPWWLAEAYRHPIHPADVGLVSRNLSISRALTILLRIFFNDGGCFLDQGGGTGLLVRLMRDNGFDFRWADKYATNLFAQGLEHTTGQRYAAVTAFEVFEHQVNPRTELREMAALTDTIIFSTELLPEPTPASHEWPYYSLITGQHVAFHSRRSLALLAEDVGMTYCPLSTSLHLFSKRPPPPFWMRLLALSKLSKLIAPWCRRPSLLMTDYASMTSALGLSQAPPIQPS